MNLPAHPEHGYAAIDDNTLTLVRRLPGPIARVWSYLTDSALRAQWLASGDLPSRVGMTFELVWRNDELSQSTAERPAGFSAESRATCTLTEFDPPHRLRFTWPDVGDVSVMLEPRGEDVLLTLVHRGAPDRTLSILVAAGWHAHLDILVARVAGSAPPSFWPYWQSLQGEYGRRMPS